MGWFPRVSGGKKMSLKPCSESAKKLPQKARFRRATFEVWTLFPGSWNQRPEGPWEAGGTSPPSPPQTPWGPSPEPWESGSWGGSGGGKPAVPGPWGGSLGRAGFPGSRALEPPISFVGVFVKKCNEGFTAGNHRTDYGENRHFAKKTYYSGFLRKTHFRPVWPVWLGGGKPAVPGLDPGILGGLDSLVPGLVGEPWGTGPTALPALPRRPGEPVPGPRS